MTVQFRKINPLTVPRKSKMKWDALRDVIETMAIGEAFEFSPATAKEVKVIRQIVSDYGLKTGKTFSVIKNDHDVYVIIRSEPKTK